MPLNFLNFRVWRAALLLALLAVVSMSGCKRLDTLAAYKTRGHPLAALVTPDGGHLLVTEDAAGEDTQTAGAAGLEVFRIDGRALVSERFIPLPGEPEGMTLIPGTRTLAFGLGDSLGLLDLDAAVAGQGKPVVIPIGKDAGPHYIAVSPDGRFLFATVEYAGDGEVEIIALGPPKAGYPTATVRAVISAPQAATGLALSPDGSRLYVVSEVAPANVRLSGLDRWVLNRADCRQGGSGLQRNGVLYDFDVVALLRLSAGPKAAPQAFGPALISRSAADCSPVRLAVSADRSRLFVTARGDNRVLIFDARKLETDPDHALIRSFPSGGEAPVGAGLTAGGRELVVADSNRFNAAPGVIAVLDAQTGAILARFRAGVFPRNVEAGPNGVTYVTDFGSKAIEVVPPLHAGLSLAPGASASLPPRPPAR